MRNFKIKLTCYICDTDNIRIRVSIMTFGGILFFVGLQGLFDIFEMKIMPENNIKLYSSLSLLFGIIFLLLAFVKTESKTQKYYELSQA